VDNERGKRDLSWLIKTMIKGLMNVEEVEKQLNRLYIEVYLRMYVLITALL